MTIRPLLACLATALLTAGSAAAQPAPGTPADAKQAVVRLAEAIHARDWLTLAAFMDTADAEELATLFPTTAGGTADPFWAPTTDDGLDPNSLSATADDPAAQGAASVDRRYRRLVDVLYAGGPQSQTTLVARMMALAARCDSDSTLLRLDDLRYTPVRADVRADGTVEVIGRVRSAADDGEASGDLVVAPLRWSDGRWTVDTTPTDVRDADGSLMPRIGSFGAEALGYALVSVIGSNPSGPMPACLVAAK